MHADSKFGPVKSLIKYLPGGPLVNMAAENEHVPDIERQTRVVNEWCRATHNQFPFQRIPNILTTHIVITTVKMLNFFLTKGGISEILSPNTIMSGKYIDFKKYLCIQLGKYYQVHEEKIPRNIQDPSTKG